MSESIAPHGGEVRVFFMDEARLGQQGTLTRVWCFPSPAGPDRTSQAREPKAGEVLAQDRVHHPLPPGNTT